MPPAARTHCLYSREIARTGRAASETCSQPKKLFRLMSPAQQQVLFENIARAMGDALRMIRIRHIGNCYRADPAYGEGVSRALGIPMSEVLG